MKPFITPAYAQTAEAVGQAVKAGDALLGLGPFGALLVLLLMAGSVIIWVLWKRINERDDIIRLLQEKRADEARVWAERVAIVATTSSTAMASQTAATEKLTRDLDVISDQIRFFSPAFDGLSKLLERNGDRMDSLTRLVERGGSRDR